MPLKSDMRVKLLAGIWRIDSLGRWYPDICGAATDEGDNDNDTDDDNEDSPKTFTQADLDRLATKQKREGKRAAHRELMERLGFDSIEETEKFIQEAKDRADSTDQDADKRLKKIEDRERKAEERIQQATRKANEADVMSALIAEGLDRKEARRAARLVELDLDSEDLDEDEILAAVDELREEMPRLFAQTDETETEKTKERPPRGTPDSTPRGRAPKRPEGATMKERGRSRLQDRHGDKLKNTA